MKTPYFYKKIALSAPTLHPNDLRTIEKIEWFKHIAKVLIIDGQRLFSIGEGTFSTVFKVAVKNGRITIQLALKLAKDIPHRKQAIEKEHTLFTLLGKHPHIIAFHGKLRCEPSHTGLWLDYYESDTYRTYLDKQNSARTHITQKELYTFLGQIGSAFNHCHKNGIIHADFKPENCLVKTTPQKGPTFVLTDFNSGFTVGQKILNFDIGSRYYKAPEVLLMHQAGTEIDIWSFGCTVIEFVTQSPLFPGKNNNDMMQLILKNLGKPYHPYAVMQTNRHLLTELMPPHPQRFIDRSPLRSTPITTTIHYDHTLLPLALFEIIINDMLAINPDKRASAAVLLKKMRPYLDKKTVPQSSI